MKNLKLIHLKNEMLYANFLANFIGVFFVNALLIRTTGDSDVKTWSYPIPYWIDTLFSPFAFSFVCVMTLLYEKPIRRYLDEKFGRTSASQDFESIARRRLLNEPFILIALDFSMWLLSAIIYPTLHWIYGSSTNKALDSLYQNLSIGVITVTVAFFYLSTCCKSGWRRISFQTEVFLPFRKHCGFESEPAW